MKSSDNLLHNINKKNNINQLTMTLLLGRNSNDKLCNTIMKHQNNNTQVTES